MFEFHPEVQIRNARCYNSYFKTFSLSDIWISDGRILHISPVGSCSQQADNIVDADGRWMVPGLIDIHMHVESSMLCPSRFGRLLSSYGVTTVVSEPHEMANVRGISGIFDMIEDGKNSPVDIFYAVPSSVPASCPELETTGAILSADDMETLLHHPGVLCVGEVMNCRQLIQGNALAIRTLLERLRHENTRIPIEGHCPSLMDLDLSKYLYMGIRSDHTEHNWEELRQRFAAGMFIELQEKTLSREILDHIREEKLEEHFCFVTDDVMADTLVEKGHLNWVLRKAMALGYPAPAALYNASFTPAKRMNLQDRGALAPGLLADFSLLDDLREWQVHSVYKRGRCIYTNGHSTPPPEKMPVFTSSYYHSLSIKKPETADFQIKAPLYNGWIHCRLIEVTSGSTRTRESVRKLPIIKGQIDWQNTNDILLALVFERYGKSAQVGQGLICGDCHKRGAVASSFSHDNHNVLVVGKNASDMGLALKRLQELGGGMVVVEEGHILAEIDLPIGGILSADEAPVTAEKLKRVREAMVFLGYRHKNPIMSLATLALPVSPALKLTDKGLIDVQAAKVVPLFVEMTEA